MVRERTKPIARAVGFLLVGLLVFIVYVVFFVDVDKMIRTIKEANYLYYSFAAVLSIMNILLFTLAWQYLMRPLSAKISLKRLFTIVWASIFVDLVVPAESVSGDVTRVYLASRQSGVEVGKVAASVVSHRVLNMVITTVALLSGFFLLIATNHPLSSAIFYLVWLVAITTTFFLVLILTILVKEKWGRNAVDLVLRLAARFLKGHFHLNELRRKAAKGLRHFYDSLETFASKPASMIVPVVFALLSWASSILMSAMVFLSVRYPIDWAVIIVVSSLSIAIKSIPTGVPAEVGLPEFAMTFLYTALGIPIASSVAITILTRLLTFALRFVIGFAAAQRIGVQSLLDGLKLRRKRS